MTDPDSSQLSRPTRFGSLMAAIVLATVFGFGASDLVTAKPSSSKLDRAYGTGGMTRVPAPSARSTTSVGCFDDTEGNIWALSSVISKKRGQSTDQLTKLTSSGRIARGFGKRGLVQLTRIEDVQQTGDGGFLVLRSPQIKRTREHVVTRLTRTGRLDKRFATNGSLRTGIGVGRNRDIGFETLADGRFVLTLNKRTRAGYPATELRFFDRRGQRVAQLDSSPLARSGRYIDAIHGLPGGGWLTTSSERTGTAAGRLELQSFDSSGMVDVGWGADGKAVAGPPEALVQAARRYASWENSAGVLFGVRRVVSVLADGRTLLEGYFATTDQFDDALVAVAFVIDERGRWDASFGSGGGRLLWIESDSDADGQYAGEARELIAGHRGEFYSVENSWTEADTSSLTVTRFDQNGRGARRLLSNAFVKRAAVIDAVPSEKRKRVHFCAISGKHAYVGALKSR